MTSDSDDEPEAPRLDVALPHGDLRRELLDALGRADVVVERMSDEPPASAREALRDSSADIVVLRRRQLDEETLELLRKRAEDDDAPDVIVVSANESEAERAALVAAGAAQVLDPVEQSPAELARAIEAVAHAATSDEDRDPTLADFLSRSPYMRRFMDLVHRVAGSDSSLLITGETGVGKEHLARAIHAESTRGEGPFVAVNCAALPESLIESELFGHERGAFTGAERERAGHFEAASGGTIFLDEIGETPQHVQVKLLNVLQRREVQRLGAEEATSVDVRVMAATNRDVEEEVRAGRFREDLYFRLNVVPIRVPSLRERTEDIPDLIGYLVREFRGSMPDKLAEEVAEDALAALQRYSWPGNVRELINVVEHAMLLTDGRTIELRALPEKLRAPDDRPAAGDSAELPHDWSELSIKEVRERAVARAERAYLDALLTELDGHVAKTAERAGISPRALYDRMRRHGLDKDDYKRRT